MLRNKLAVLIAVTWILVSTTGLQAQEQGGRGRHKRIYVVPRSGPVVIAATSTTGICPAKSGSS
jgi:hypothetical protein